MTTTALQQLTIFIARLLVVQVYSGERVVERCALVTQAEVYWSTTGFTNPSRLLLFGLPSKAKVLTGGGDLRFAQVDVRLSVSHSCV
jgi:hypothetical protein